MTLARQYAKAFALALEEHPRSFKKLLSGLSEALARRGHLALLPRIAAEYERLELRKRRVPRVGKEEERTRVLLALYRHLTRKSDA